MVDLRKTILLFSLFLTSCTILITAPRPETGRIKYTQNNYLKNKVLNIKFMDKRDDKSHQVDIKHIFQNILENQVRALNGKISPDGDGFIFSLQSYEIANSHATCTVIIAYEFTYLSLTDKQVVTDDIFPCSSILEKRKVATSAINIMLKKISERLQVQFEQLNSKTQLQKRRLVISLEEPVVKQRKNGI